MSRRTAYLLLLLSAVCWGLAPPIIKLTLNHISVELFLFYRFLFVCLIIFIPFLLKLQQKPLTTKQLAWYLGLGFLATPLNLLLLFSGIKLTSSTDASVLAILSPMLIIVGGLVFLKEKLTHQEQISLVIIFLGACITTLQPLLTSHSNHSVLGNLLVLGGDLAWAAFSLLAKSKTGKTLDPFLLTCFAFFTGLLCFAPLVFLGSGTITLPLAALPGVLYMVIFGSLIGYFAYTLGLARVEASEAGIFTYLQPIFAFPLAILLLAEFPSLPFLAGATLIGLGVYLIEHARLTPR